MAFACLALGSLGSHGTLGMITPNSLFEASSGTKIRAALAEILAPQLIARLGEQTVFSRALVDAGMYVARKHAAQDAAPAATAVLWADARPNSLNHALRGLRKWRATQGEPITDEGFSVYRHDDIGRTGASWVARGFVAWSTYKAIQSTRKTVPAKRIFDIKQGVRLGNDIFVLTKERLHELGDERRFFRPAVMNPSITDAQLNDEYYVFYPYSDGLPSIAREADLEEHVPMYFHNFLLPAKSKLSDRKSLAKAQI